MVTYCLLKERAGFMANNILETKNDKGAKTTKNSELLSTFKDSNNKRMPIQTALTRPLYEAIGQCFLLLNETTEEIPDSSDETKVIPRAVYEVRVVSSTSKLNIGTVLIVKIKGKSSILTEEENRKMLLGVDKSKIVAFDDLSHWNFNNIEGLSASNIRELDITAQEAMKM